MSRLKTFIAWSLGLTLAAPSLAAAPTPADAGIPTNTYAQALVDRLLARNPDILVLAMHVTPPKSNQNVIIASNIGRIGKPADEDDLGVINSGKPKLGINAGGDRFESLQVLQDVSGDTIGAIGFVFAYRPGTDTAALHRKATRLRDGLRRHILSIGNLMDPMPYVADPPTCGPAQRLADRVMAQHKDLLVIAMHASPPGGADHPIIASSIGRIGKKADEDDMRVINTGQTNLEVSENGKRFEVELLLLDRPGKTIGALGLVFPYRDGQDKAAFKRRGEAIRNDLRRRIASIESLCRAVQ